MNLIFESSFISYVSPYLTTTCALFNCKWGENVQVVTQVLVVIDVVLVVAPATIYPGSGLVVIQVAVTFSRLEEPPWSGPSGGSPQEDPV